MEHLLVLEEEAERAADAEAALAGEPREEVGDDVGERAGRGGEEGEEVGPLVGPQRGDGGARRHGGRRHGGRRRGRGGRRREGRRRGIFFFGFGFFFRPFGTDSRGQWEE